MSEPALAKNVKWDLNLSLVLTGINIVGASVWWIAMPQRLSAVEKKSEDHETRIRVLETTESGNASTMSRIDERTKAIQEDVRQIHQDFSFHAGGSPTLK